MCSLTTFRETSLDMKSRALHNVTTQAQDRQPGVGKLELPPKAVSFPPIPPTTPPYTQEELLAWALGSKSFP